MTETLQALASVRARLADIVSDSDNPETRKLARVVDSLIDVVEALDAQVASLQLLQLAGVVPS